MKRKIAAILSLDVVDYTRRMSEDSDRTLKELQRILGDVVRPSVLENEGRLFKLMGDGALAEFETATSAINAASAILQKLRGDSISLRGGIHAGDVTVDGDDLFGEAVNVASRLQSSAQPDACLVSKTAVDIAGTSLAVSLRPESSMRLKGLPNPVDAFSIDLDGDGRHSKETPSYYPSSGTSGIGNGHARGSCF